MNLSSQSVPKKFEGSDSSHLCFFWGGGAGDGGDNKWNVSLQAIVICILSSFSVYFRNFKASNKEKCSRRRKWRGLL